MLQESPNTRATKPKLLEQVRQRIRTKHYSIRTEQAYVQWITEPYRNCWDMKT